MRACARQGSRGPTVKATSERKRFQLGNPASFGLALGGPAGRVCQGIGGCRSVGFRLLRTWVAPGFLPCQSPKKPDKQVRFPRSDGFQGP
jgi:hypothetical protein